MQRRLTTILSADVAGYSRLMGADEASTLAALKAHRAELIEPKARQYGGRTVKLMGDGQLMEFTSVVEAVRFAVEVQCEMRARNRDVPPETTIEFRIGINVGDIILDGGDVYGDGVNIAARLEALAEPGGICVRRNVRNQVRDKLDLGFEDLGEIEVKNIARPVRVFRVILDERAERLMTPLVTPNCREPHTGRSMVLIIALAVAIGVGVGAWFLMVRQPDGAGPGVDRQELPMPSIAVLPFASLGDAPEDDYFADGLTEDLITDLAKISGLAVIAQSSTAVYGGEPVDLREVGRQLGARYVLEGSVRRAGEAVRITAQLADTATGHQVWAERYEGRWADVFALQDAVISRIVDALSVTLTASERDRLRRIPTSNLEAYDFYLKAEASGMHSMDAAALKQTLAHYQRAIELDPDFAEAHAGYARANAEIWRLGFAHVMPGALARKRAYEAASRALELDPENAEAYTVLALMQLVDMRHDQAIASGERAIALAPSDPDAHAHLAYVLAYAGEPDESRARLAKALSLAPHPNESLRLLAGIVHFTTNDYEAAIRVLEAEDGRPPDSEPGKLFLAAALAKSGETGRASAVVQDLLRAFPNSNLHYLRVAYDFYRREADREAFLEALRLAGLPEWPFGFESDPRRRVTGAELEALTIGRTWSGVHETGVGFFQHIAPDGRLIYRSAISSLTGQGTIEGDRLCIASEGYLLGRKFCGSIYRLPEDSELPYVYVSPDSLMRFRLVE